MKLSCLATLAALLVPAFGRGADAPRHSIPLDGPWKLSPIQRAAVPFSLDAALATGTFKTSFDDAAWGTIDLPTMAGFYDPESDALPPGSKGKPYWFGKTASQTYNSAWYRREFDAAPLPIDGRVFLKFTAVGAEARVWVNGTEVGRHFGGFSGFELDITKAIDRKRSNEIAVYVTTDFGEKPNRRVYGKMFFAQSNAGGIVGPVAVESRPIAFVQQITLTPHLKPASVDIDYVIDNAGAETPLTIRAKLGDTEVNLGEVLTGKGLSTHHANLPIADPKFWTFGTPNLYHVTLTLDKGDSVLDRVSDRFGLREFVARDGKFFLNGVRTRFYYGNIVTLGNFKFWDAADRERFKQWLLRQKKLGVNTLRYHMAGVDSSGLLSVCDEVGMMIIDEWPWFHRVEAAISNPAAKKAFLDTNDAEMKAWISRDINHPSNVLWSLSNEVWTKGEIELLNHTYETLRPLDKSGRPMSTDSGFHSVLRDAPFESDVYDLHNYSMHSVYPWSLLSESVKSDLTAIGTIYGCVAKPVIISESLNVLKQPPKISGPLTPEVYVANAKAIGVREVGLANMLDPKRGYPYLIGTFGVRCLEQFRQQSGLQGFSAWFQDRNFLPASIGGIYGPYYVGFSDFTGHAKPGMPWHSSVLVTKDPLDALNADMTFTVTDPAGKPVYTKRTPVTLAAEQEQLPTSVDWTVPMSLADGIYTVTLGLEKQGTSLAKNDSLLYVFGASTPSTLSPKFKAIALYDPSGQSPLAGMLKGYGVSFERIQSFDRLKQFDGLVLAPGWNRGFPKSNAVREWVSGGGRLLAFEATETTPVPWSTGASITVSNATRQPFVDLVVPEHTIFAGLSRDHFDGWNGDHRLLTRGLIAPLSVNALAAAGSYSTDGELTAVCEAAIGKGSFLMSQLIAVDRAATDPVAERFVYNCLNYVLCETPKGIRGVTESPPSPLLIDLHAIKGDTCKTLDLKTFVNAGLVHTVGTDANLDLRAAPVGRQTYFGIPFDLIDPAVNDGKAVLVMQGNHTPERPQRVTISVGQKAQRLLFLQTAYFASGNAIAKYHVEYADGTAVDTPVDATNVGDWFEPKDMPQAPVAWSAEHPLLPAARVGYYLFPWTNPNPQKLVKQVTVISEGSEQTAGGSLILLAVTLQPVEGRTP